MKNRKNRPVNGKVFRSGVYSTAILRITKFCSF